MFPMNGIFFLVPFRTLHGQGPRKCPCCVLQLTGRPIAEQTNFVGEPLFSEHSHGSQTMTFSGMGYMTLRHLTPPRDVTIYSQVLPFLHHTSLACRLRRGEGVHQLRCAIECPHSTRYLCGLRNL